MFADVKQVSANYRWRKWNITRDFMNINYDPRDLEAKKPCQQNPGRNGITDNTKNTQTRKNFFKKSILTAFFPF